MASVLKAWCAGPTAPVLAIVLACLVASAGCQSIAEPTSTVQIGTTPASTKATDYPSLHTVPPRPQLSYSVQQRRAIVDGLIADRANARYTDQVVRYRTGRSTLPPPPAPPPVVAAVAPEVPAEPAPPGERTTPQAEAPAASGGVPYPSGSGDDTLGDFVDEMVHDTAPPPSAGAEDTKSGDSGFFAWFRRLFGQADKPAPEPDAATPTAAPVATIEAGAPVASRPPPEAEAALAALVAETRPAFQPAAGPEPPADLQPAMAPRRANQQRADADVQSIGQRSAAADGGASARPDPGAVGIAIDGGAVAIEVAPPAAKPAPAAASASAPAAAIATVGSTSASDSSAAATPAGRVPFAPGSAELPDGIGPQLEQVLATARTQGALIRIVGEADAAALALDRARAVAIALVRLGARAGDLDLGLARHATGDQARLLLAPASGR